MPRKQKPSQKPNVDSWMNSVTSKKLLALEHAAKLFPEESLYDFFMLEGMYGKESSFGTDKGEKNSSEAVGDFQIKPDIADKYGLKVSKKLDERFDVDKASKCAARYVTSLDRSFGKKTNVGLGFDTIPVKDSEERQKFALAAYNAGANRIARAQKATQKEGKNPTKWDDVKKFLKEAGCTPVQAKETAEYPDKVLSYSREFKQKSNSDGLPPGWRWITKDGNRFPIKRKY